MYGPEISQEEQNTPGNYTVTLSTIGNPDFREDPTKPLYGVPSKRVKASSISDASEKCKAYIAEHEVGGGNWTGGNVLLDGELVARISYNGRAWHLKEVEQSVARPRGG